MCLKLTPYAARIAVQDALVCLLAYLAGFYFTRTLYGSEMRIGALWSVISGIVVLQGTRRETLATAWLRTLGTLIGAIISAAYLLLLAFSPFGMALSIGTTILLCHTFRVPDHARLAAITVAVIMVVSTASRDESPGERGVALRGILYWHGPGRVGSAGVAGIGKGPLISLWPAPARLVQFFLRWLPLKHQGSETSRQYPQDQSQNEGQARGRGRAFPAQLPAHGRDWQRQSLR